MSSDVPNFRSYLRVDPGFRCAAIALPGDSLAILPFFQTQAELDTLDQENSFMRYIFPPVVTIWLAHSLFRRDAPYSPSFILDVSKEVDTHIKHIIDFIFLPGFSNITMAIMYQTEQTWTWYEYLPRLDAED